MVCVRVCVFPLLNTLEREENKPASGWIEIGNMNGKS